MELRTYWGKVTQSGSTITLDADEEKAKGKGGDGIGSALTFLEWDGSPLRLMVERTRVWWPFPWADFWFVARESAEADPWPMRYVRFTMDSFDFGRSDGGSPKDQWIGLTWSKEPIVQSEEFYRVSWLSGAMHIEPDQHEGTYSLPAPVCELGLYAEGCVVEVTVE